MHVPWFREVLGLAPISVAEWALTLLAAGSLLLVIEVDKVRERTSSRAYPRSIEAE
ncbi:hypothetical protein [Rhizobium bangladeshense]|uniref:hypothetical protein n=1 Tax=Rhizobium bangladeshense TaxID=1138189 RepID=UPI001C83D0D0|nr:hypothetical protein [Rhizobium bangladeshense]MBX4893535.1 hypothetical protein [Rhizobium bangladeshense]MBX4898886.1 hypothetical protein [Rhizobium bangladeshense]MBY3584166.1 hypothetical protein [Rhizobium bangladeshense]MBY3616982.1 hypothetical protein [Rhizobium bangladeshense]